ncbi:uncharacterized protein PG986_010707 [Apiospora aurea]|uniref:Uncharacterized protein n=1 Tax=Apiospora aurea TaxID=335848 RepID=A0ABR1Q311_9PEZI
MVTTKAIGGAILSARLTNGRHIVAQGSRLNPVTNVEEPFQGPLYDRALNVSHLDDTAVTVEDMSDLNVEYQHPAVKSLLDTLGPSLKADVFSPAYMTDNYELHQDRYEVIIENFFLNGFKVHRRTYPMLDAKNIKPKGYSDTDMAKVIGDQANSRARLETLDRDKTLDAMARLLCKDEDEPGKQRRFLTKNGSFKKNEKNTWSLLKTTIQGQMFQTRNDPAKRKQLLGNFNVDEAKSNETFSSWFKKAANIYDMGTNKGGNKHNDYLLDVEAAELCEVIAGQDIVILRDKNHELIAGVITEATQRLFPSVLDLAECKLHIYLEGVDEEFVLQVRQIQNRNIDLDPDHLPRLIHLLHKPAIPLIIA